MKMQTSLLKAFVMLVMTVVFMASCKKDDVSEPSPIITNPGLLATNDTITVGESVTIHPLLSNRNNTSYKWTINDTEVGTDSVFVFTPDSPGSYTIRFNVTHYSDNVNTEYKIHVWGKYENGFFIINEGQFGTASGSVNFYRYGVDSVEHDVFAKENPGKALGATTQSGQVFNQNLYLVSKEGPLVIADAKTLVEKARITLPASGRAFTGIDETSGLLSTDNGLYTVSLLDFTLGNKVDGIDGEVGAIKKVGEHIYIITQNEGLLVTDRNFNVVATRAEIKQGIVEDANNQVWLAGDSLLLAFNKASATVTEEVILPFNTSHPWFAWREADFTGSESSASLFIAEPGPWGGGNEVYKFSVDNAASFSTPFFTVPGSNEFYGSMAYDKNKQHLIVSAIRSGWGTNAQHNTLYIVDNNGSVKNTVEYTGYYFPAMIVLP